MAGMASQCVYPFIHNNIVWGCRAAGNVQACRLSASIDRLSKPRKIGQTKRQNFTPFALYGPLPSKRPTNPCCCATASRTPARAPEPRRTCAGSGHAGDDACRAADRPPGVSARDYRGHSAHHAAGASNARCVPASTLTLGGKRMSGVFEFWRGAQGYKIELDARVRIPAALTSDNGPQSKQEIRDSAN
jgi:hypothetical protein